MVCLPVGKHLVQAFVIGSVNGQLICKLPGHLSGFFAPKMATHALASHELASTRYVYARFCPFVCFKFWHLPVLLLDLDYCRLIRLFRPFQ